MHHFQSSVSSHQIILPKNLSESSEYMSPVVVNLFKEYLILWKKYLLTESEEHLKEMRDDVSQTSSDLSDLASYEESISLHLRHCERDQNLIRKIDEALHLIQQGDYGYCLECGIEIGYERMIARPTADMCVECKNAAELKERHTGSNMSDDNTGIDVS
jgi:DnaK suppressor protein